MENKYIGIELLNIKYETIQVSEYIEKFKMYRIDNLTTNYNNQLFKIEDIENLISKQEKFQELKLKSALRNKEIQQEQQKEMQELKEFTKKYNNDYGYTNNKNAIQKAKILKVLNAQSLYGSSWYTRKDLIIKLINENSYTKEYLNNNRYSKKKVDGEYKKLVDKLEYRFYYKEGKTFLDVTKTEFDFINYLLENKIYC